MSGLIEQGVFVGRHDQEWHQILKHGAAPRQQQRVIADDRQQATQREPVLLWHCALSNCDKACETRLRRQQIIVSGIAPMLIDVVAHNHQVSRRVVNQAVVNYGKRARFACETFERFDSLARPDACDGDTGSKFIEPCRNTGFKLCTRAVA